MSERLVWMDCEMTGLNLTKDALIEVAVLITDDQLNVIDEGLQIVIAPPPAALETMPEVVRTMHQKSGLLEELPHGVSLEQARATVLDYVKSHIPEARKTPLAGNSIATDRGFIARDMPELDQHLHYRMVDVSSIKELVRRWYPRVYFAAPEKGGNHRALGDIRDSINELRYYRATVFAPDPGPTTEMARAAATALTQETAPSQP